MLSMIHDDNMMEIEKQSVGKTKRKVVLEYENMSEVENDDKTTVAYLIAKKRLKNMKIFLHLLDIIYLNSYLLYQKGDGMLNRMNFLL